MLMAALGFWVAMEVGGAAPAAAKTIKIFTLAFVVVFGAFVCSTISRFYHRFRTLVHQNRYVHMMHGIIRSDWVKACGMLFCPILPPVALAVSYMNERVRVWRGIQDVRRY